MPITVCDVPEYEEFPYKVTFKDGSVKFFSLTESCGLEIKYKPYQLKFLFPCDSNLEHGEKLDCKTATEWFGRVIKVCDFIDNGEAYDTLQFLKFRKDKIGALSYLFLSIIYLYQSVDYKQKVGLDTVEYWKNASISMGIDYGENALVKVRKCFRVGLYLAIKVRDLLEERAKGNELSMGIIKNIFYETVDLWKEHKSIK